jgi:hypothetical protein
MHYNVKDMDVKFLLLRKDEEETYKSVQGEEPRSGLINGLEALLKNPPKQRPNICRPTQDSLLYDPANRREVERQLNAIKNIFGF